jgi:hypothetical protein
MSNLAQCVRSSIDLRMVIFSPDGGTLTTAGYSGGNKVIRLYATKRGERSRSLACGESTGLRPTRTAGWTHEPVTAADQPGRVNPPTGLVLRRRAIPDPLNWSAICVIIPDTASFVAP